MPGGSSFVSVSTEARIARAAEKLAYVTAAVETRVLGQRVLVHRLLVGLLTKGHVLLEGLPGLAKTLTVRTLAEALGLEFSRVQFTPDLLPSDVTGTQIYHPKTHEFEPRKGPIFANLVLADEINRAPAKVQAALLEAMQERQVTIGTATYSLPNPFLVLATQNPIEQEGTYPLPEAQVDRFLLKVNVHYPDRETELKIVQKMASPIPLPGIAPAFERAELPELHELLAIIRLEDRLARYIVDLVQATRDPALVGRADLAAYIEHGASPRASIGLHLAARAQALLNGREYVGPDDIKALASDLIAHRLRLTYAAEADGFSPRGIVAELLNHVPI